MGLSTPMGQRTQRPIPPAGIQAAICYAIIDLGSHNDEFKGQVKRNQKVKICWEFPFLPEQVFDEVKGPQRLSVMQDYNVFSDPKSNFMKALTKWRNGPVDIANDLPKFVGQSCQIFITHTTKDGITYANVDSSGTMVMPASQVDAQGVSQPVSYGVPKNPMVFFDTDKFSWPAFHSLWGFVQTKIKSSLDWNTIIQKYGPEPVVGQAPQPQQVQQFVQQPQQPVQPQIMNAFAQPAAPQPGTQVYQQPVQQQQIPVQQIQQPVYSTPPVQEPTIQGTGIMINGAPPQF